MSWTSKSSSSASSGQSNEDYALSLNVYGDGTDPASPAHWEVMIHKRGAKEGDLYRIRKSEDFYYDPPKSSRPIDSAYGRCEIEHFSGSLKKEVERVLNAYGNSHANLPRGNENSQNWTVRALEALERENSAPQGTRNYWDDNVGRSSADVGDRLQRDGKSWISNPIAKGQQHGGCAPVGRLDISQFSESAKPSKVI